MADLNYDLRHDHYVEREPTWRFNQDHFKGGRTLYEKRSEGSHATDGKLLDFGYLPKFQLENATNYERRARRAIGLYDNLVRRSIQVYQSQIFRTEADRKLSPRVEPLEKDVDLFGNTAHRFFRSVGERRTLFGTYFALIDAPRQLGNAKVSSAVAQQTGVRAWVERVSPLQVIDWSIEMSDTKRRGSLNYAVIHDANMPTEKQPFATPPRVDRFRLYKPGGITVITRTRGERSINDDATTEVIELPRMAEVPLVPFYDTFESPMQGSTVIDDVSASANALWHSASVCDESYYYHGFNILAMYTDKEVTELEIGEDRGLQFNPGDRAEYLVPGDTPFEVHRQRVAEIVNRVGDLVFSRTTRKLESAQIESEGSKEVDRQELVSLLENKAQLMQDSEMSVWRLLALQHGASADEAESQEITYPRKFDVSARKADEWVRVTEQGIYSLAEWYINEHPGVEPEDAWLRIKENLDQRSDVMQSKLLTNALGEIGRIGADDDDEDEDEIEPPDVEDASDTGAGETEGQGEEGQAT